MDVREAIAKNGGRLDLKDASARNYSVNTPYGSGLVFILDPNQSNIADLKEDGVVNFVDYALMTNDYEKDAPGKYLGDITGANGVPDGYVDVNDLSKIVNNWLWTAENYGFNLGTPYSFLPLINRNRND